VVALPAVLPVLLLQAERVLRIGGQAAVDGAIAALALALTLTLAIRGGGEAGGGRCESADEGEYSNRG
jgi:hypothetical protein